ncbi:hypothetical protein J2X69_003105 [Algoriphagus sp. 4150]|uniref:hypothetical protein n=1 Tax=Algoriphagus sp. 4150 TaxID=2817756 RepID=UPI00285488EA|nr:hypothetical protein [Algoriphagus sp. 4150]MDR7130748.1 hypothetical protein [Algoriphagus sp. 4150]
MKKLLLFLLFASTACIPVFSQAISSKKYDFTLTPPSSEYGQNLYESNREFTQNGLINDSIPFPFKKFDGLGLSSPSIGDTNLLYHKDQNQLVENPEKLYSLRIFKPSGNHPIQIYEPDSTKNFTLLIKEY